MSEIHFIFPSLHSVHVPLAFTLAAILFFTLAMRTQHLREAWNPLKVHRVSINRLQHPHADDFDHAICDASKTMAKGTNGRKVHLFNHIFDAIFGFDFS